MATSRYSYSPRIRGGTGIGTIGGLDKLRKAVQNGRISTRDLTLKQSQRLDHIAARSYGNSSLWWIIAAASGIGWALQVPAGTIIKIPTDVSKVYELLR